MQDSNYEQCIETIQTWLDMLAAEGNDLARGVYVWFWYEDEYWKSENSSGIMFEFVQMDFGARVPACGGATGLCNLIRDPKIEVNIDKLGSTTGNTGKNNAALLGHEITHLQQGDRNAWSILGEAGAYRIESLLRDELGTSYSTNSRFGRIVDFVDKDGSLSHPELVQFDGVVKYDYTPLIPILSQFTVNYTAFVQDSESVFLEAAKTWQNPASSSSGAPSRIGGELHAP